MPENSIEGKAWSCIVTLSKGNSILMQYDSKFLVILHEMLKANFHDFRIRIVIDENKAMIIKPEEYAS